MALAVRHLNAADSEFHKQLHDYIERARGASAAVENRVRAIIEAVRSRGDAALLEYSEELDDLSASEISALRVSKKQRAELAAEVSPEWCEALAAAAARIRAYAGRQRMDDWHYVDSQGVRLGQKVTAIDAVGIYIPGGKAAYPSSVLMNAIPAQLAGVPRIVAMVPSRGGRLNPSVMAALELMQIDEIYTVGGAQAIAALAYGTDTIAAVSKIVGPGNAYVSEAKRQLFGRVGIDTVAGPSEILIIADGSSDALWVALDLFSQAEHDEQARAILLCPNGDYLNKVYAELKRLLPTMERAAIIEAALNNNGLLIKVDDIKQATQIANSIAPEHLELALIDAEQWVESINNAGAIFVGAYSCEVLGDYCAGSNHVLPTGGSARFASPLGVYDFQKRTSLVHCDAAAAAELAAIAVPLATAEGLHAHAAAAQSRVSSP